MDIIEKIRAEIERNRQAIRELNEHTAPEQMSKTCAIFQYSDSILSELLSFLSTLEEQECPEYCIRSHCIGCSKYNPDEWSNEPRIAKIRETGEIVEGFTDGQGHFDVFTDHNICTRYDVNAVEFDTLESEKPNNHDGIDKKAGKRLRRVCNLAEELKEDRPLEERLQELKEIRAKKDLDEAAKNYALNTAEDSEQYSARYLGYKDGAKWQKEQDDKELSEKIAAAYQLGIADKEKQMMKEAVEGKIEEVSFNNGELHNTIFFSFDEESLHVENRIWVPRCGKDGDKVRIIIVKED